jgi:hypothetical protein
VLQQYPPYVWVDITTLEGETRTLEFSSYSEGVSRLDLVVVPKDSSVSTTAVEISSPLKRMLGKWRRRRNHT